MIVASFVIILAIIIAIGLNAARRAGDSREGYYLAGASSPPWLTALAALATNNSGYLFTGFIGFTYIGGLQTIWLSVGWILGDFIASLFVYKQLRVARERTDEISFAAVLGTWNGGSYKTFRRIAALVTVVFLTAYASAQIAAGGKALFATLDLAPHYGAIVTVGLVILYGAIGGVSASMWANATQFVVMLAAMVLLLFAAFASVGGLSIVIADLSAIDGYLDLWPSVDIGGPLLGGGLFIVGWVFAGLSVVGQPHIMTIYMTLKSPDKINETRWWYYSFYLAITVAATLVGLTARAMLPDLINSDPELALPIMARELFPAILVGVILAGVFSATLSTIDSLVLASSAAITNELPNNTIDRTWKMRAVTTALSLGALGVALNGSQTVFSLVVMAWSTLGSAFGPMLIVYALGRRLTEVNAIIVMAVGAVIALLWRQQGWHTDVYEGFPGIGLGLLLAWALSTRSERPAASAAGIQGSSDKREVQTNMRLSPVTH
ncbi:MAG: sodium/proline symporter [Pseudomonadota bacterium]